MNNNRQYNNNRNPNEAHVNDETADHDAPARAAPRQRGRRAPRRMSNENNEAHFMEAEDSAIDMDGDDFESFYMAQAFDLEPELYESDDDSLPVLTRRPVKRYDSDDESLPPLPQYDDDSDDDSEEGSRSDLLPREVDYDSDSSEELPGLLDRSALYGSDDETDSEDEDEPTVPARERPYVPVSKPSTQDDVVPQTIVTVKAMNGADGTQRLYRVLLDSGATFEAMIKASSIPKNVEPAKIPAISVRTTNGSFIIDRAVTLEGMKFPEFSFTSHLAPIKAVVFESESCSYDIILGRACLKKMGVSLDFANSITTWLGISVPFRGPTKESEPSIFQKANVQVNPVRVDRAQEVYQSSHMTRSRYFQVTTDEVLETLGHLNEDQKGKLGAVLDRHAELFSGKIGSYPHRKFHIDLKPEAVPHYQMRPYPIKRDVLPVLKDELAHQEKNGIIERCYESEWCLPLFAVPKKQNEIRTVHDLRQLNKWVVRKQYPLPRIQDIFHRRRKYKLMSKLDISMQYYTFVLDEESTWLCVFVTPFGKYRYLRLPMGLNQSPDWAQATMEKIFQDMMDEIEIYIDDIGVFDTDFDEHLRKLEVILSRLQANGFTVNPLKCEWCVKETDFLGFWMTPDGIKPWKKRVEPILAMKTPQTLKELRAFIGMINYYRDMWQGRSHVLAPLTALTKIERKDFKKKWSTEHDVAFEATKALVAQETLLVYPDPNVPFLIETDASDYQLGAVLKQNGKPVAFFSRKLTEPQRKYSVIEKELLSILETLEEFRQMIWGTKILIRTDHQNLAHANIRSQRVLNWRLLVEDFKPEVVYYPGELNVEADTLSRYPRAERAAKESKELDLAFNEAMVNVPMDLPFPLAFPDLRIEQEHDDAVMNLLLEPGHELQDFHGTMLVCKQAANNEFRIVLPQAIVDNVVRWYHLSLMHSGEIRTLRAISRYFYSFKLKDRVHDFVSRCDSCQRHKNVGAGYGELPPRNDVSIPWEEVAVDLIGPWNVNIPGLGVLSIRALTIIDTCSGLAEIVRIPDKYSSTMALLFDTQWLSRYPRPLRCIHDPGTEFVGPEFQTLLVHLGIQPVPSTVKNPQSNAICERLHGTIGDMLRTSLNDEPPNDVPAALDLIDSVLAAAQFAARAAIHTTLGVSPGALVFQRDMVLPIPLIANYENFRARRQARIDNNARAENLRRRFKDYDIGDEVLILSYKPHKLEPRATGPFVIAQVHVNGTVTIQRNDHVYQRINIRRVRPYLR